MSIHLVGGGSDVARSAPVYAPFLREVAERGGAREPRLAVLLVLEADDRTTAARFAEILGAEAVLHTIVEGEVFDPAVLDGADGVAVGGGLTPAYAVALAPLGAELRRRVGEGMPYLGFSAGAACAAATAILGGYRHAGIQVVPEEAGEELDEVTVAEGLGLVPFSVEVHAAQWGTLPRAVVAVESGRTDEVAAIDEYTVLIVDGAERRVVGEGRAWRVVRTSTGVTVAGA